MHDRLDDLQHGEGHDAPDDERAENAPAVQLGEQGQRHGALHVLRSAIGLGFARCSCGRRERLHRLARGLESVVALLGEAAPHDRFDIAWDASVRCVQRRRILVQDGVQVLDRRAAPERRGAAEHLVEQRAHAEEIRARVSRLTAGLLGRHISRRAEESARHRALARDGLGLRPLRETKIEDLDAAIHCQKDVGRLQVAVNHPDRVRSLEGAADAESRLDCGCRRERTFAEPLRKRFSFEELGDEIGAAVLLACIEHGDDVGVVEASHRLGLALEALLQPRARALAGAQHLDRYVAAKPLIVRAVDLAHPSSAQRRDDAVPAKPRAR